MKNIPRLYIEHDLQAGIHLPLESEAAHYVVHVMRLREGDCILVFNGRDGEWQASISAITKRQTTLEVQHQTRPQTPPPHVRYLFAPLKQGRLDYMVQKAVEMGAATLEPVLTAHTQVSKLGAERLRKNAIEAAEQCGILNLPTLMPEKRFADVLASWPSDAALIFCDEAASQQHPLQSLQNIPATQKIALLIGPEGGFSTEERQKLLKILQICPISLGPRILRADTAAVAAFAWIHAARGF